MEFYVNEAGCSSLADSLQSDMNKIAGLINEIEQQNSTLQSALGEDADTISASVRKMTGALQSAQQQISSIRANMSDYMSRVHQAKVVLH